MLSLQRSTVACREFGIAAGTFLIMASLVTRVQSQSTEILPPTDELGTTLTLAEVFSTPSVESAVTTTISMPVEKVSTDTAEPKNEFLSTALFKYISTSMPPGENGLHSSTEPSVSNDDPHHEQEIELELIIIILATILIVVAVMIVVAALIYWCCVKRRNEKQSRFVKFKKSRGKRSKYDKMDVEMGTLPRNEPSGGGWIFNQNEAEDDDELEPMNLNLQVSNVTNDNYDPEMNGNIDKAPSISDYHSETNPAPLSLEDDDNDLNVNPMYSLGRSSRGSVKDSGVHEAGSDDLADGEIRSDNDLNSFADETVEL